MGYTIYFSYFNSSFDIKFSFFIVHSVGLKFEGTISRQIGSWKFCGKHWFDKVIADLFFGMSFTSMLITYLIL